LQEGRLPFDLVLMSKILVLQALNSFSDEATEFQIKGLPVFQRFLDFGLDGTVPDATTVWLFRERLAQAKAIDKFYVRFDAALKDRGYLAMGGQIIDATVVPAPKQRNTVSSYANAPSLRRQQFRIYRPLAVLQNKSARTPPPPKKSINSSSEVPVNLCPRHLVQNMTRAIDLVAWIRTGHTRTRPVTRSENFL